MFKHYLLIVHLILLAAIHQGLVATLPSRPITPMPESKTASRSPSPTSITQERNQKVDFFTRGEAFFKEQGETNNAIEQIIQLVPLVFPDPTEQVQIVAHIKKYATGSPQLEELQRRVANTDKWALAINWIKSGPTP